jgi:hypothetical protein
MRPGGAQMICAAFSPGGLFLATGSADHHVRVYMMDGKVRERVLLEVSSKNDRNMDVALVRLRRLYKKSEESVVEQSPIVIISLQMVN